MKIALVTGGSRGIGRAVVLKLASRGVFTYINFLQREDQARETLGMVRKKGGDGALCRADVADGETVETLVRTILEERERLDILVNNAGVVRDSLFIRMSGEGWERMLSTNLLGVINCSRAAARPMMKQRWGRIINISSVVAQSGNAGQCGYGATKAAVEGLTRSLARELGGRNICINAVSPGLIETEILGSLKEKDREKILQNIPLARMGTAEEVASLVGFLASEEAGYITGQVIRVNGGLYM